MAPRSPTTPSADPPLWVHALLYGLAYAAGSEVGYALSLGPSVGGTFWPPAGISLAFFLSAPYARWPALVAVGAAVNFLSDQIHNQTLPASLGFAVANLGEPLLGAFLLRRFVSERFTLSRLHEVVALAAVACLVTTPIASALGALVAERWTANPPGFLDSWTTWWVGDAVGTLVLTPVTLHALQAWRAMPRLAPARWLEAAGFAVILVAVTQFVFKASPRSAAMPFFLFPVLLWASLRFGVFGVGAAILLVALLTTRDTALGLGPFAQPELSPGQRLLAIQVFLGVSTLSFAVLAVLWDERTRATRALRYANADLATRYQRLVEQSPLAILAVEPSGAVREANPAWVRLWSPGADAAPTNTAADPRWDELGLRDHLRRALAGEFVELPEVAVPNHADPAAEPRTLRGVIYPLKDAAGEVTEAVVIQRDITEQVRAQRALIAANQALRLREEQLSAAIASMRTADRHREELLVAERSSRAEAERASTLKDQFLATLSHELRTPLNAILGWAQILLRRSPAPDTLAQGLATIERNARAQSQLIEDLLDTSRIVSGKVSLSLKRVRLGDAVAAAVESLRPAADAKGLTLTTAVEPAAQTALVDGDPGRLQQIVTNLVSNAVKFTPDGGAIDVRVTADDHAATLTVRDTGQGIDHDFAPHLFERFRQGDGSITRSHGGLGLGLSIVRHIAEMHGGSVSAQSDGPGTGSTFTVTLPLAEADRPLHPHATGDAPAAPLALPGLRVLVVDDDQDARDLLRRLLSDHGCEVAAAASADEALQRLAEHPADALVSDIGMPGTDGYELLRRIRAHPDHRGLKAVAVTAFARPEDRDHALAAGFDAHVPKPIDPALLLRSLGELAAEA